MLFRPQSHFSCFSTFFICFFPLSSILFLSLSLSLNVSFFYFLRALFYFSVLILSFLFFCFYLFSLQIYPSPYIFFKKKTTFLFFLSIFCALLSARMLQASGKRSGPSGPGLCCGWVMFIICLLTYGWLKSSLLPGT